MKKCYKCGQVVASNEDNCPYCGVILRALDYCPKCNGRGIVQRTRNIELKIPKGVDDGSQLRLSGEGEAGSPNGTSGDLYIVIHIKKHSKYNRRGSNLHIIQEISFPMAALGGKIDVETIDGTLGSLKIPEGTQNGDILKIRNKGMPQLNGRGFGDLYIEIHITTPRRLNRKSKKLLEELKDELKNSD